MDRFEALEVKGLYDYFKERDSLKVWALSNGVRSRETYLKLQGGVAPVLNLVIRMESGVLARMEWRNDCVSCAVTDCKLNKFKHPDRDEDNVWEQNCFVQNCKSSKDTPNCDSKIYVTWVGNDGTFYCTSDNNRITNFQQHSIKSYFQSASEGISRITSGLLKK